MPPARAPTGLAFVRAFLRNPLEVIPRAAYEEDLVVFGTRRAPRAWVTSPTLIKAVLLDQRDNFRKLNQIRLLGPLLGRGILTSEGADWKWQRQAAAPMFRAQSLDAFVPACVRAAEDAVARWQAQPRQSIDEEMTRTTFDVISATLLPSADRGFAERMHGSIRALQRHGGWDILYAAMQFPKWLPRPGMGREFTAMRALRAEVAAILREQRGAAGDSLLRRLVDARDPESGHAMDDEQLVDNLLTFYLAGHDTTAKALTWTLYLLARSPRWSAALEEEVDRVTQGEAVQASHLERLVLLQQVLKESMRLYPPVPIMSRQAIAGTTIEGREIPQGMSILMPIYAIHRHARWQRPDEFDPARFAPGDESRIPRYQYMPFGAGPRICIGMAFAMMEAAAILATLVQRVRFEAIESAEPVPVARVTLMPRGGLRLGVSRRA